MCAEQRMMLSCPPAFRDMFTVLEHGGFSKPMVLDLLQHISTKGYAHGHFLWCLEGGLWADF